jgi:hypothetical protein
LSKNERTNEKEKGTRGEGEKGYSLVVFSLRPRLPFFPSPLLLPSFLLFFVIAPGASPAIERAGTLGTTVARAQIIDRILAVVNGEIITLSDVRAAQRFGLVAADGSADPIAAGMQQLIDRRLMLAEVDRYAPAEPPAAAIDSAVDAVVASSKDASDFETMLIRYGMSREQLRRFVRDTLRLDAYLQQRSASMPQPSAEEIERYYKEHPAEFTANGALRPFEEVRAQAGDRAIEARRAAFVRDWVEGLRRRASLVVLYLPGK